MLNTGGEHEQFGSFTPQNLISQTLTHVKVNKALEEDNYVLKQLQDIRNEIYAQERFFYSAIGVNNFEEFKSKWQGSKSTNTIEGWINYLLTLLTGTYQRLASSEEKDYFNKAITMVNLIAQELDIKGTPKKNAEQIIKQELIKEDLAFVGVTANGKEFFSPAKNKLREFVQRVAELYAEQLGIDPKQIGQLLLEKRGFDLNSDKNLKWGFQKVSINYEISKGSAEAYSKEANRALFKHFSHAMSKDKLQAWENFQGKAQVEQSFYELCLDFFKSYVTMPNYFQDLVTIQGFFGELYTHGKLYFNIKGDNEDIEVINTGALYSMQNEQAAYDTVIYVGGRSFGIQTKNPFDYTPVYKTYENTYNLAQDVLYRRYLTDNPNSNDIDNDFKDNFQHINLNLYNYSNPEQLKRTIEAFLYLFSPNFMRIQLEQVREKDIKNLSTEIQKRALNTPIRNIFFVVFGELIPTSRIFGGVIAQYQQFINMQKGYEQNRIWTMTYTNNVKKNLAKKPSKDAAEPGTKNLLSQIKIKTGLKLQLNPIIKR